jgi:hypothetical protein
LSDVLTARLIIALVIGGLLLRAPEYQASTFASQIAALSERAGYFDTDNLISNERSYLQVVPDLRRAAFRGGAYVGVGPDQNFSYIAAVKPSVAFIIDVRRDNMLLHLLFKGLFQLSQTRVEYLALLLGRPVPPALDKWRDASIDRLAGYVDGTAPEARTGEVARARAAEVIGRFGVPLSREDLQTIDRFHRRFIEAGLDLRFQSTGRPPQTHYPTYRELLNGKDPEGSASNYLATENAFQFIKRLHSRDLIIPVVGNLSGPSALSSIGAAVAERREVLSVFYASNVEFYLFGEGTFREFITNLRRLPYNHQSVIVRSVFGRYAAGRGGSSSHTQSVATLLDDVTNGRIRSYGDLVDSR